MSVRARVGDLIQRDGVVRAALARGIINLHALARELQKQLGDDVSIDAIIDAVRRSEIQRQMERRDVRKYIRKFTLRDKLADVALVNESEVREAVQRIAQTIDVTKGETFRIVSGVQSLRIVLDMHNLDKVEHIAEKYILRKTENTTEITALLTNEAKEVPGILAAFCDVLAVNDINLVETMTCHPELVFELAEKDAVEAYRLFRLFVTRK